MVRERLATVVDVNAAAKRSKKVTPHQESIFFALRELTGADPGPTVEDWKKHFRGKELKAEIVHVGLEGGLGVARLGGSLFVSDKGSLLRKKDAARLTAWRKDAGLGALALGGKGGLLAIDAKNRTVVKLDASTGEQSALLEKGKKLHRPLRLVGDRNGGAYVSDDANTDVLNDQGAVHYVSAHGSLTKLSLSLPRPRGLALSKDGKTLYVGSASSPDVMAYEVESAGSLGKGRRLTTVGRSTSDVAVDGNGNVCELNVSGKSVEVFSPVGLRLGRAELPDEPAACFAEGTTLYVLTKTELYRVDLSGLDSMSLTSR
jgi:sugar lactone lactonase YvrE